MKYNASENNSNINHVTTYPVADFEHHVEFIGHAMMFNGQEGCVHYYAYHDEKVEDGIMDYYIQKVLKLEPGAIADAAFPTLVAVAVHHFIL